MNILESMVEGIKLLFWGENKMEIRRLEEEQRIARLRSELDGASAPIGQPIIWLGTQRELAAHIVDLYNKGKISATSERQAVMQSAPHFVIKSTNGEDPRDINPDSLWRNYHQQIR